VTGAATYATANLRPETTGLPFVVFIIQSCLPRRCAQLKVSVSPRINHGRMAAYVVSPFGFAAGAARLMPHEEGFLRQWVAENEKVLLDYWDGTIAYTEIAIEKLVAIEFGA